LLAAQKRLQIRSYFSK